MKGSTWGVECPACGDDFWKWELQFTSPEFRENIEPAMGLATILLCTNCTLVIYSSTENPHPQNQKPSRYPDTIKLLQEGVKRYLCGNAPSLLNLDRNRKPPEGSSDLRKATS